MKIESTTQTPVENKADAIVIGIWADEPLVGAAEQVDQASGSAISKMIELEEISAKPYSLATLYSLAGVASPVVVCVGLGKRDEQQPSLSSRAAGSAAKHLAAKKRESVAFYLDVEPIDLAICGSIVGCVGQDLYQHEPALHPFQSIAWAVADTDALTRGRVLGESTNLTRRLVNMPANEIYPETFADQCVRVGNEAGFEVEVWDEQRLAQENCGAILAVGQASERPPRIVIMTYSGGAAAEKPLGLVGKGVTFDSGGLSLKPSSSMIDMKCDMTGAATVLGAMQAIANLKLPVNVYGLVGLAENMISGNSYRLGDVLTARSGKTIEVHNTDAEGRIVLADTLNVAIEQGVGRIVDLATLTGACMVALGRDTSGLMTNEQAFCDRIQAACDRVGESAWQLPMFPEFAEHIKSKVADIKNVGDERWGGAITAAKFLEEFVQDTPWVHVDIAGPSFQEKAKPWVDAGASGCFVTALVSLAEE